MAVIVLTQIPHRALWELAKENGAYACFHKYHTSGEDLDKAIQRAIAFVGQMPKEDLSPHPPVLLTAPRPNTTNCQGRRDLLRTELKERALCGG